MIDPTGSSCALHRDRSKHGHDTILSMTQIDSYSSPIDILRDILPHVILPIQI